jgi:hypothetical protein
MHSESDEEEKYHASKPSMKKVREILKGGVINPPRPITAKAPPVKGGKSVKNDKRDKDPSPVVVAEVAVVEDETEGISILIMIFTRYFFIYFFICFYFY